MKSLMKFVLACLSSVVTGVCLAIMWKWFVTPLGVPAISVIHAIALGYLRAVISADKDPNAKVDVEKVLYAMLFDGIALGFAFVIHLAM